MITLSLCMIVKNEEKTLETCLNSVKSLVDEIIIVDTGSTDNTKQIAKKYTDKVYDFEWIDDFSAARNFSFSKATKDFILWLDADDIIRDIDYNNWVGLKRDLTNDIDTIYMRYNTGFDVDGNVTFSYYRERIVKRINNFQWMENVHEYLSTWGKPMYSDAIVTHNSKKTEHSTRNIDIYEGMIKKGIPLTPRGMYYYARELKTFNYIDESIQMFLNYLKEKSTWSEDCINACLSLGDLYVSKGLTEEALTALFKSFYYDTPRGEICCSLGEIFLSLNKVKDAIYWYTLASNTPLPKTTGFVSIDYYGFIPLLELCVIYDRIGEIEKAMECNNRAASIKPNHSSVLFNKEYFSKKNIV